MKYEITKKEISTDIVPGIIEREGKYIICPECRHKCSYRLTESDPGAQIEWHCPECRKYLGGVVQDDGMVERIEVEPARKWILIEIDADSEPAILAAFRPQSIEEATRKTRTSGTPACHHVPVSFSLRACEPDTEINPQGFPQYQGSSS